MAKEIKTEVKAEAKTAEPKFLGRQLLKMDKYKSTVARVAIKSDKSYSFKEADEAINNILESEDK